MKTNPLPLRDAWVIWFILGVVMLNYPFLHIFNKDVQILGIPLTVLYFFIGWPISIGVVALFATYLGRSPEPGQSERDDADSGSGEEQR